MYSIDLGNDFTGVYMSVEFAKGKGQTDSEYLAGRFEGKGFSVEKAKPIASTTKSAKQK